MERIEANWGKWVVKYRWLIISAAILMVGAAGSGIIRLTFNKDTRVFFSEDNPQLQALEALENTYNKVDVVFFALAPANGEVFSRETLAAVEELTAASWQMPYSSRVNSLGVNSTFASPAVTVRLMGSSMREPTLTVRVARSTPRRSSARTRAMRASKAKGLAR